MKKLNKSIFGLGTLLMLALGITFSTQIIYAQEKTTTINQEQKGDVEVYKNSYVWKYKIVNGKLYKRKLNEVTGEWVGKWMPA